MRISLLGPVELVSRGASVPLGGRKQRAVFALLALDAGRVVPVDRLLRELWPEDPPSQSMMALQSYVSRLRRVLAGIDVPASELAASEAPPRIVTKPPGWVLEVPAGSVDTAEFARLVGEGRDLLTGHQPQAAATRLSEALSLWAGPPMGDLVDMADFATTDRDRLDLQRLDATESLLEAQLAAGESATVAESADRFTRDNPFRERAWTCLMLALYRSGRQADALAAATRLRTTLADELGLDPSPEVTALVERMLRHDPDLHAVAPALSQQTPPAPTARSAADRAPSPVWVHGTAPAGEPAQPLVGRDDVVAILEEVLTQADRGRGRAVLIEGAAGIGKSSVLNEVQDRVGTRGGRSASTAGVGGETGAPAFWPWVQILRSVREQLPDLAQHPSAACLALIDPALAESAGSRAEGGDTALGRTRLYRAVIDLLATARSQGPLTIVLDDAQWLDDETVRLLGVAVPELVERGVLFVFGFRSDETTSEEGSLSLLGDLRRDAIVRLQLRTLDLAEVGDVVKGISGHEPEDPVSAAIFDRTRGNPLFVTELVRLLVSEHRLDVDGVREVLPTEVRTVLRRRLARVPEDALTVLVVVALVGRSTEYDLLVEATGMDEDRAFDACEAAVLTGLLIDEADGSGLLSLSHDLVRQTLAESVSPARRVRWHAKIGAAIAARPLSPDRVLEVAEHLRQAAPVVGPAAAIPYLVMAADDALARLALRVATRILLDAMDLVNRISDPIDRGAAARLVQGRLTVAQIYNKGPIEVEGSGLLELREDDARFPFDPADPTEWWAAMTVAVALGQYERMALEAQAALRDDLPLDVAAVVRLELGLALFELGHFEHARAELEQAEALMGDGTALQSVILSLTGGAVHVLLGMLAHFRGDEAEADILLSRAAENAGDALPRLVVATFGGAWLAAYRKDLAACTRNAEACAEVAREMDYPAYVGMGEILGGWARVMGGDPSWLPELDKAYRRYVSDGTLLHNPIFLTLCAEAHDYAGEPAEARALVEEARGISAQTGERSLGPRLSALADLYAGPLVPAAVPEH